MVYGYLLIVPLVVWLASKYLLGIPSIGIVQLACLVSFVVTMKASSWTAVAASYLSRFSCLALELLYLFL